MTSPPPGDRVAPTLLEACVRPDRLPARWDCKAYWQNLSAQQRGAALQVLEAAFFPVAHHLSTPPEAWRGEGRRTVRLWDLLEFSVDEASGLDYRAAHLGRDPGMSTCVVRADLSSPVRASAWPPAMDAVLVAACSECGVNPRILPGPAGAYLRRVLARTFNGYVDWNRLRRSLLRCLAPDPLVTSLARRIFDGSTPTLEGFNWVARNVRELSLVAIETPALLPFLQLVELESGPLLPRFDRAMARHGMTPSARRKLEHWGFDNFAQALHFDLPGEGGEVVAGFANLLDRVPVPGPPGSMFTELVLRGLRPDPPAWFLRSLWDEVDALSFDFPDDPMPVDFEIAAQWLACGPLEPDDNQKRAGWSWIVAQACEHHARVEAGSSPPWPVPSPAFDVGRHHIVPIGTLADLREEALAMRNCLENFEADCRVGRIALFSMREGRQRVACFSLARSPRTPGAWRVSQVAGRANATVPEEIARVAATAAQRISPACESHPPG